MFIAGDFRDQQATARAILNLKSSGFTSADVGAFSDRPIEFPAGVLDRPSHMSFAVVTAAITSCLLIIGFVYFTQYNYPIITGGMPVFSFWATGVVFYELTMFGAIVASFFWFLRESGLLRLGRRAAAPAIKPGVISLRVEVAPDRAEAARHALVSAGAEDVRSLENAA